ncbi:MAG TPA: glycerate kinase [Acidimicrobiales bacterium]|nr:glycerate kinase [Acidimicrobiales bacterium]
MPHLVAAFDKFRGTATAAELSGAAARAARAAGWSAEEIPLADGGEGTLDALARVLGGELRQTTVRGPLGEPVDAPWLFVPDGLGRLPAPERLALLGPAGTRDGGGPDHAGGPVAVVEAALAAGRALLPSPQGNDPVEARTDGVGDLIAAALGAGARLVIVAVGGSATTDGGLGAVSALGTATLLGRAELVVACDVSTPFRMAAETFAPQKGATPEQVTELAARLGTLADRYRDELGVDVDRLEGAGAAGGLAGGLAALGARLVPGFALVAALVGLDREVASADLVTTGEGRLDATSFSGKVVGGVLDSAGGAVRTLCIVGQTEAGVERHWAGRPGRVDLVSLVERVGETRARRATARAVFDIVAEACRSWPPGVQVACPR